MHIQGASKGGSMGKGTCHKGATNLSSIPRTHLVEKRTDFHCVFRFYMHVMAGAHTCAHINTLNIKMGLKIREEKAMEDKGASGLVRQAQLGKILFVLKQDLRSVPSTHMMAHNTL